MAFKTEHIQVDGSINIDGSIFQWNSPFIGGGGGGGGGDVAWASGSVGSNNQVITAAGDGSIVAESGLTYDGTTLRVTGDVSTTGWFHATGAPATGEGTSGILFGNGGTNIHEYIDNQLVVTLGTTNYWRFTSAQLRGNSNGTVSLQYETPTMTNPTVVANNSYTATGLGGLTDTISLISNGTSRISLDTSTTITGDLKVTGDASAATYSGHPVADFLGAPDISTLDIASYVNSSTYYDGSLNYRIYPNPSTGLSSIDSRGMYAPFIAGEAITAGRAVHMHSSGKVYMADADASNGMPAIAFAPDAVNSGATGNFLLYGPVRNTAWTFTIGEQVYILANTTTDGQLTSTMPSGTGDCVQVVGIATSPDSLIFNPSPDFVVIK